jgi:hypothetical protein
MYQRHVLGILLAPVLMLLTSGAIAQQKSIKDQLAGAWTLVLVDGVKEDDTHTPLFEPNPIGSFIFTTNGRFSAQLMRSDRASFASKNRDTGLPKKTGPWPKARSPNSAPMRSMRVKIRSLCSSRGDSYPNREGIQVKWQVTSITDDMMTINTPASSNPAAAYATIRNIWKKVK